MPIARTRSLHRAADPVRGGVGALAVVLLASGCLEFRLDPIDKDPPPKLATVTEIHVQDEFPGVDLLLVLDRTGSMAPELDALAQAADRLGEELDAAALSWQLGVIGAERSPQEAGWLLGDPWILTTGDDLGARIQAILDLPVPVSEQAGLAAAIEALDLAVPSGVNAGFRRVDAALHVVFFSDGDDESDPWLTGSPVDAMVDRLQAESGEGLPARASAVVGDGSCNDTGPGDRYVAVAEATGGVVVSICANTFAPIVEELSTASVMLPDTFVLREEPASSAIAVTVDGVAQDGGWTYEAASNAIRFDAPPPARSRIEVRYTVRVDGS